MGILRKKSPWSRVSKPLRKASGTAAVRSGLATGAAVVALSAASAATSAIRRQREGSS